MNQLHTQAIVLSRTEYGEADRIISVITPHMGKLSLMAKGVRRIRSKLAGGIELFSTTELSYIQGRGSIHTLTSARLLKYYSTIVQDITRVQLGYELIKILNRATEDNPEQDYFELLQHTLEALDDARISISIIRIWFYGQLIRLAGHSPNLMTDIDGAPLQADATFDFNFEHVAFEQTDRGSFTVADVKFLRILFSGHTPDILSHIDAVDTLVSDCLGMVTTMLQTYIRI